MTDRSQYYQIPITISLLSVSFKYKQDLHCLFCGMPFTQVSDRVLSVSDSPLSPEGEGIGPVETRCPRHTCKQRWALEFAL